MPPNPNPEVPRDTTAEPADGARRRLVLGAATAAAASTLPAIGRAQAAWPNKPVRVIVPFPPGGLTDGYARAYSDHLSRKYGQQFVVENKSGAAGTLGAGEVAKAAPDGYTLLVTTSGPVWAARVLYSKLPYNPDKDFVPIALFPSGALILGVPDKLPVKNAKELLAYAKANSCNMGSYAAASWPHMIADTWNQTENTQIVTVHYRGESPMWVDVVGGQVQMAVGSVQGILPHIQRGAVRAIAATGKSRSPKLPDVPTFVEMGFNHPVFALDGYLPMCAPAGTPRDILEKIAEGIREAAETPRLKELQSMFGIPVPPVATLADARRVWDSDSVQWIGMAEKLGIKLD